MRTQLIGVHAVKQGGKDTTLRLMQQWCDAQDLPMVVRGFADELKISIIQMLFGIEVSPEVANAFFDEYKEDITASVRVSQIRNTVRETLGGASEASYITVPCFLRLDDGEMRVADATVRDLLIRFGTDVARDRWDKDFWVERLLPGRQGQREEWLDNFVVRDVELSDPNVSIQARVGGIRDLRFINELNRLNYLGALTVKVRRQEAEDRVIADAKAAGKEIHESDLLLSDVHFDAIFDNNGTIDDLTAQVDEFMSTYISTKL